MRQQSSPCNCGGNQGVSLFKRPGSAMGVDEVTEFDGEDLLLKAHHEWNGWGESLLQVYHPRVQ